MNRRLRPLLLGVGFGLWLAIGIAQAGALIVIPNLPGRTTPAHLLGYLARPDGEGPFPAVVVLHGCLGISGHSTSIADRLRRWGYVGLTVDSLGPRGIASHCGRGLVPDQAFDAFAALRYLSQLDFVDPARVALLGNSMGGSSALYAVDRDLAAQYFDKRFRAAIAYYPGCGIPAATMTAPTLILIGEVDDWTPAERCRDMVAHARSDGAPIALTVYPGAFHDFDASMLQPAIRILGHRLEYNEPVAKDAEEKTRAFLAANLGSAPSDEARAP